jgi:hypothetical protein
MGPLHITALILGVAAPAIVLLAAAISFLH